ncbi:MAG TPA: RNA polymerase subunit sigma-70 [Devosia sp.]|jgi:RNA polymerase sigma-70 factor (ECF subfamily)|nr:RNA polymerase subunit sigma-70 [Devosia sp.]
MTDASDPGTSTDQPFLDQLDFELLTLTHRRALKVHCYRMMGTLHEADDLVQDTFLQAWRSRADFKQRGSLRGWLYAIATNACLNALNSRTRTSKVLQQLDRRPSLGSATGGPTADGEWLEPYPDSELPDFAELEPGPLARYETREAVQLAFVAAIQLLPPRQRAVLLLTDVLGWSAFEASALLGTSTASTNSALQRARATLAARSGMDSPLLQTPPSAQHSLLLERYMRAWHDGSIDDFTALLREDATYNMPPWGEWYEGRPAIHEFFQTVWNRFSGYHPVPIAANAQLAVAIYARTPQRISWQAHSLHIIQPAQDGSIVALTVYVGPLGPSLFPAFGLPLGLTR